MKEQIQEHQKAVEQLLGQTELLEEIARLVTSCFRDGGRLYIFGNGGSAADAQHIAAELVGRFKRNRRALPAVALTTDTSVLTAVTNDMGGEYVFARQVEALVTRGDAAWALSVSGRSPNVLRGLEAAKAVGALAIGFTSRGGSPMAELCHLCLLADHDASDRVQEIHQLAYHLVCDAVERRVAE